MFKPVWESRALHSQALNSHLQERLQSSFIPIGGAPAQATSCDEVIEEGDTCSFWRWGHDALDTMKWHHKGKNHSLWLRGFSGCETGYYI